MTVREFDLGTRSFVKDGFVLPQGKQRFAWAGEDTLLVAREWNKGELTASGYPYIVKRLVRGRADRERGRDLPRRGDGRRLRREPDHLGRRHWPSRGPHRAADQHVRGGEIHRHGRAECAKLSMPLKSRPVDLVDGQLIVQLSQAWDEGAAHIRAGGARVDRCGKGGDGSDASRARRDLRAGPARVGRRHRGDARPAGRQHQSERARADLRLRARGERHVDAHAASASRQRVDSRGGRESPRQ